MTDYTLFYDYLKKTRLEKYTDEYRAVLSRHISRFNHGDGDKWETALSSLPELQPSQFRLNADVVQVGSEKDMSQDSRHVLKYRLMVFHPWRKGPYRLFGLFIDTEWRSDLKWNRLISHIQPLKNKTVLDVGCGNGYHCWRMRGEGARLVVGIEPYWLYVYQFFAVHRYLPHEPVFILPMKMEEFPPDQQAYDTVFSMGVLYHQKSPVHHLLSLKSSLKAGGELVLETLVMDGGPQDVLVPESRYAKMRNVWFIPSTLMLETWLKKCGYRDIRLLDVSQTTTEEQRSTEWMTFESLPDFLSHGDPGRTVEGYPAPTRAIFSARIY